MELGSWIIKEVGTKGSLLNMCLLLSLIVGFVVCHFFSVGDMALVTIREIFSSLECVVRVREKILLITQSAVVEQICISFYKRVTLHASLIFQNSRMLDTARNASWVNNTLQFTRALMA